MHPPREHSIMMRILGPVVLLMVIQALLFAGLILWGGTIERLNGNAADILNEKTVNRKNYLENEMIQRWSNLADTEEDVDSTARRLLEDNQADYADLTINSDLSVQLLDEISEDLIYLLRRSTATGAFVILDGGDARGLPEQGASVLKSAVYIRDLDPLAIPSDYSDLMMVFAPTAVSKRLGISLDIGWEPQISLGADSSFYYEPLLAARAHPEMDSRDLGYWCGPVTVKENDLTVITYTRPLLAPDGAPYGVVGVEVTVDYLRNLLPYGELGGDKAAAYALGVDRDGEDGELGFTTVLSSGPAYTIMLGSRNTLTFDPQAIDNHVYVCTGEQRNGAEACAGIQYFKLYNTNTPFEDQRWALISLVERGSLFAFSARVHEMVILFMILSLTLGIGGTLFISYHVTRPITALAKKVRDSDPRQPVHLDRIWVREIDQLSLSVEYLSSAVAESSSKISKIIDMSGTPIGAFEYDAGQPAVQCTSGFFQLMERPVTRTLQMPREEFEALMKGMMEESRESSSSSDGGVLYQVGGSRWLRLKTVNSGSTILGVMVDVTQEIMEKRKVEYERDYDLLTGLLNRRAFHNRVQKMFEDPGKLKISALTMMDLDNLKYINDTYGHDCGDEYIRCAADVLRSFSENGAVAARMSGDEFFIFFTGYDSRDKLRVVIEELRVRMAAAGMLLPDGQRFRMRASAGVAWYPDDSNSFEELTRFADFAMYQVKHTVKGGVQDFDLGSYRKDSFLLHSKEELNRLIEEELVDYVFQPIVEAATGDVLAYETLMRPRSRALGSPTDVLRLAKAQSKLYQIERLTWFKSLSAYEVYEERLHGCKIFVNSIASERLTEEDLKEFDRRFGPFLDRIVIELTESEKWDEGSYRSKKQRTADCRSQLALDDFGTGYNSNAVLLDLMPDYVKIDMSIVRGIGSDPDRRAMFQSLADFSHGRGIKVVAEGVETAEELQVLLECGTDYFQGYFFGKPELIPQEPYPRALAQLAALRKQN